MDNRQMSVVKWLIIFENLTSSKLCVLLKLAGSSTLSFPNS